VADCLAETILVRLDLEGVAASSGSACSSGAREPSHVLAAMGVPDREIRGAIRLSAAPSTTEEELSRVAGHLARIVEDLRRRPRTD
jgi:cysteine desulfurase